MKPKGSIAVLDKEPLERKGSRSRSRGSQASGAVFSLEAQDPRIA